MKKITASLLPLAACAFALCGCHTSRPATVAWEYHWITPLRQNFEKELNAAGRDGWELVSATPDANPDTMSALLRRPAK
jgi:hypothetical protein